MVWPGGVGSQLQLRGRSRDLLTRRDGSAKALAEAGMTVGVGAERTIEAISVWPERPNLDGFIGAQGGSRLRSVIDAVLPGEREGATPLYFILDDIAGTSLIAGFAWSQIGNWPFAKQAQRPEAQQRMLRKGRIICSGLRPGGYHEVNREQGNFASHFLRRAGDLSNQEDPSAWHDIEPPADVCMRRRRRLDIWRDGDVIRVDGHFRDSTWNRDRVEMALHEYTLDATIDASSHELLCLDAVARVLPFPECPWAAPHASTLIGMPVDGFRTRVQETLNELQCCTHLNDMLRGLAEVPVLAGHLSSA